jgi:hypothetical protein
MPKLKLTDAEKDLISKSTTLGEQSFLQTNSLRVVATDTEMTKLLSSVEGEEKHKLRILMMKAWYGGWDKANVAAASSESPASE